MNYAQRLLRDAIAARHAGDVARSAQLMARYYREADQDRLDRKRAK